MALSDEAVIYYRQTGELTQLLSQQVGLVIATLPQSFAVQWHWHQNLPGHRANGQIVIEQLGEEPRQSSEVSIL